MIAVTRECRRTSRTTIFINKKNILVALNIVMAAGEKKRPLGALLLAIVLIFYGVMGVVSGLILIPDPSGAGMGFTSDIREDIPFQSFLPVGLFLFTAFGLVPLLLAYGAVTMKDLVFGKVSEISGYHWSWTGAMLLVLALVLWLTVEGMLIGLDYAATYMTVIMGSLVFVASMLPSTRKHYRRK